MATERLHIPIDQAGRVVLPKPLRDRLGLHAGTEFEVIEEPDRVILKPVPREAKVVKKGSWSVFSIGSPATVEMVNEAIKKTRR